MRTFAVKRMLREKVPIPLASLTDWLDEQPDDEALLQLYTQAHLTVFPSAAEGWGLPVAEALWLGRPVVTAPVPAARALQRHEHPALTVVASDEPTAWAHAIRQALPPQPFSPLPEGLLPSWEAAARFLQRLF